MLTVLYLLSQLGRGGVVGKCVSTENPKSDLDLDLGFVKTKVVCLNGLTLETSLDLNPISHGGHLTLFFGHLNK